MMKVVIKESTIPGAGKGVFSVDGISKACVCIGKYEGRRLTLEEYAKKKNYKNYIWEIKDEKGLPKSYIDGGNKKTSNWLRYVNCSNSKSSENVEARQIEDDIYYFTNRPIEAGEELFVYYGDEYATELGLPLL